MSSNNTVVDFLRHGHCQGGEIFRGATDVQLSEQGWQQLRNSAGDNKGQWEVIISSPLQRCRRFAEECAKQWDVPLFIDPRWHEISFGDWDGQLVSEVWPQEKSLVLPYMASKEFDNHMNMEPIRDVAKRAAAAWDSLLDEHRGKRVLVICHGGIIRIHLSGVLGLDLTNIGKLSVPYASLNRVTAFSDGRERVDFINSAI